MPEKPQLLVVLPEVPVPPRRNGLSLRYNMLLRHLGAVADIDLVALHDGSAAAATARPEDLNVNSIRILPKRAQKVGLFERLLAQLQRLLPCGIPYEVVDYRSSHQAEKILDLPFDRYDAIVWVTLSHTLYRCLPQLRKHRLILDVIDSPSLYVSREPGRNLLAHWWRVNKMRRWERKLAGAAYRSFYISPEDSKMVADQLPDGKVEVMPNGVFMADYTEALHHPREKPSIGFLGNMSYAPNIDAAHRLCRIFYRLRQHLPDVQLYIIGRDPDPSFNLYQSDADIVVTGTVESIWPYVNSVDVFVMPLSRGAGQQNKLLEVMYAGRPVISTRVANGGVMAVDGESIVIADDDESIIQACLALLGDPVKRQALAREGQTFIRTRYDWAHIARRFADVIDGKS